MIFTTGIPLTGLFTLLLLLFPIETSAWISPPSSLQKQLQTSRTSRATKRQIKMTTTNDTEEEELVLSTPLPQNIKIILASQSPRRGEIMTFMNLDFIQTNSPLDESKLQQELRDTDTGLPLIKPTEYVQTLSEAKAKAMAEDEDGILNTLGGSNNLPEIVLIIGSDTIVDLDGTILEKPTSKQNAIEILSKLSSNWHQVHTGLAIYMVQLSSSSDKKEEKELKKLVSLSVTTANVKFGSLSSNTIERYVETGEPMDKAGAYGIQGIGGQLVEKIEGDYFTIMGLPMRQLSLELARVISEIQQKENES